MKEEKALHAEAQRLVEIIQAELEHDTPLGPQWVVAEGERVLENANAFRDAAIENKESELLAGVPLDEFLGVSWLEVCGAASEQCKRVQGLLEQNAI
jgi:hypothetical protein